MEFERNLSGILDAVTDKCTNGCDEIGECNGATTARQTMQYSNHP